MAIVAVMVSVPDTNAVGERQDAGCYKADLNYSFHMIIFLYGYFLVSVVVFVLILVSSMRGAWAATTFRTKTLDATRVLPTLV